MTRTLISIVVAFVVSMTLGFAVHGGLLKLDYAALPNLMRSDADQMSHFPWMIVAHVALAIGVTLIYQRGREAKPWMGQGVRFGLLLALVATIPMYLIYHSVGPYPIELVVKQVVFDTISMVILGIAVALVNRQ